MDMLAYKLLTPTHPKRHCIRSQILGTALFWGGLFDSPELQKPKAGEAGTDGAGWRPRAAASSSMLEPPRIGISAFLLRLPSMAGRRGVGLADLLYVGGFGFKAQ